MVAERDVAKDASDVKGLEPVARLVQGVLDTLGLSDAQAGRITGLDRRHIGIIVNRTEPYRDYMDVETIQALAKLRGLDTRDIAEAIAESVGLYARDPDADMSSRRRTVHRVVDDFSEADLPRVLQILLALADGG